LISAIRLINVLAFAQLDLPLRGLTLLSGANSSGKSSILHSLALLRQSSDASILPESLLLNGEFVELGVGRDVLHAEPVPVPGSDEVALAIELESDSGTGKWWANYEQSADVLRLVDGVHALAGEGLFARGFQYLKADRIVPAVTYPKSHEAVTVKRSLGARGEHAPNYLRVFGENLTACEPARHPKAASGQLLDQTNAWIDELSPGTSLDVVDVEGTDFVRLRFQRSGPEVKTDPHRATNVGFGLTYALPVVIACLTASRGSLLLVENPEAHLHPRGQARLGRLCALAAAGGAQVVVESHSDHVLNAIRLCVKRGELLATDTLMHFFDRERNVLQPHLATVEVGRDGMIDEWPKGFFDQWDNAVEQLLE
jgi:predicted ATPase